MGHINYQKIYEKNQDGWKELTREPQKYEALLSGHYSDSNHFIYELLQNAEDARASKVVIEYYSDKLVFLHNGNPFDEADVRGVSSMLMGTKDRDDAQTIGRFGMGFKSVFKYTYQPEIYSDNEAFKITNYLLPVEIIDGWNYKKAKNTVICKVSDGRSFAPFSDSEHFTKIVIPFIKRDRNSQLISIPGDDVLKKLEELNGEILLFLTYIRDLYWIDKTTGNYAMITLKVDEKDPKLVTCRIESSEHDGQTDITKYLMFKECFDHPEMFGAEVSVAYKLNSRADNINETEESVVWVYFPTRDETDLPFLIHGSFETAVSREKLMSPSTFNDELFDRLGTLIADSMLELADRHLVTQPFIRKILMEAFKDEAENETIPGLRKKITEKFKKEKLLPDRDGRCRMARELVIPVPFRIADFIDKPLFKNAFSSVGGFVAFNDANAANFTEYYKWLKTDLQLKEYSLTQLAIDLNKFTERSIPITGPLFESLEDFYTFLSEFRKSAYETGLKHMRSGPYESTIRLGLDKAWQLLREAPIILNAYNMLVPGYKNDKELVYLNASSKYKTVNQAALVNSKVAEKFATLFSDGFKLNEFDNFQYIKENIIIKYIGQDIAFKNPNAYEAEHIEDIKQILSLTEDKNNLDELRELLENAAIIKIKDENEEGFFSYPYKCYITKSKEEINLGVYYATIPMYEPSIFNPDDEDDYYSFELDAVDEEFYESHGISIQSLVELGVVNSPVEDGPRRQEGVGDAHWVANGEFCPDIQIDGLTENLKYISHYRNEQLAKQKSAEILKLLLCIAPKLTGTRRYRKNNPYVREEVSSVLKYAIRFWPWIYNKEFQVYTVSTISRFELNPDLYASINADKKSFEILGFAEKEADLAEETFESVSKLNNRDKLILLKTLARQLGKEVTDRQEDNEYDKDEQKKDFFNSNMWVSEEFPKHKVRNLESLLNHVRQQFFCADPVTYEKVLRQIRVSRNSRIERAYVTEMYTNESDMKVCQMCRKPTTMVDADQIANYGIEMPQLNLCLCKECSAKYKMIRDNSKDDFKEHIRNKITLLDIENDEDEYELEVNAETSLYFTQTHLAEVQEIFRLLEEYGVPSQDAMIESEELESSMNPLQGRSIVLGMKPLIISSTEMNGVDISDEKLVRAGDFVTYKKLSSGEVYNNTMNPDKSPFHKIFIGKKEGDIITFQGKRYEITVIL